MRNPFILIIAVVFLAISCSKSPTKPLESTDLLSDNSAPDQAMPSKVSDVSLPLDRALERITKKPFGLFVEPANSPVDPEKFKGFHNATDFEIFDNEIDANVTVSAICDGKLLQKRTVNGYGGLAIQSCTINNESVTVLYGHLKLSSVIVESGTELQRGQAIGSLGSAYSTETSGERKHLHLGIHKGTGIDIRGYVQKSSELSAWLNFEDLVK